MSELIDIFEIEVRNKLAFLVQDFGFRLETLEKYNSYASFRYESSQIVLNILFSHRNHEIELEFGRRVIDENSKAGLFSIQDLLHGEDREQASFMAFNVETLQSRMEHIAELLCSIGQPYLLGDKKAYESLRKTRTDFVSVRDLEIKFDQARESLSKAWQERDYEEVIRLLYPIRYSLTASEKMKYEYAKKQKAKISLWTKIKCLLRQQ